jgi:hypothetical protein
MVYNALGSVGGWYTGSQVPWNSYISYQNDQSTDDPEPGENYDYASTADVYCTVVGLFATFPFPDIDWGEAVKHHCLARRRMVPSGKRLSEHHVARVPSNLGLTEQRELFPLL